MVYHYDLIFSYDVLEVIVVLKNFYCDLDSYYLHGNYHFLLTRVSSGRFYLKMYWNKHVFTDCLKQLFWVFQKTLWVCLLWSLFFKKIGNKSPEILLGSQLQCRVFPWSLSKFSDHLFLPANICFSANHIQTTPQPACILVQESTMETPEIFVKSVQS